MEIKFATKNDLNEIVELEKSRFLKDPWTEQMWKYEFEGNQFSKTLILLDNQKIIGYVNYWILFEQATINKVCIDETYQGRGLGDFLLKEALKNIDREDCISTSLEVRVSNRPAIKLYEKNVFKISLTKPHYYKDGEDCYFMIRSIGDVYA